MTGHEMLEKMLVSYRNDFDITRPYDIKGDTYDAYAKFNVTSAKYVLIKKAQLWRADCFEHAFFLCKQQLMPSDLQKFHEKIETFIEPEMVRNNEKQMPENHMYTYVTGIFYSEEELSKETISEIKKFKYFKNYRLGIRGYCEARILVFDMKSNKVYGNRAAKELVKGYKKIAESF